MITTLDHGPVRELRLDHPPANALSPELLTRLAELLEAAPSGGARAVVLSGAPGMFSGGLDVPLLMGLDRSAMLDAWATFHRTMECLAASEIPVAAALTGHAPAGGTVLALFCDRRVAADGPFKLGVTEVTVGIPLPSVILAALTRQIGPRHAEALAVTGALLDPAGALAIGLVDEVVPTERAVERAVTWCEHLAGLPPHAVAETRREARADLVDLFRGLDRAALEADLDRCWWGDESQAVLTALARKLTEKR